VRRHSHAADLRRYANTPLPSHAAHAAHEPPRRHAPPLMIAPLNSHAITPPNTRQKMPAAALRRHAISRQDAAVIRRARPPPPLPADYATPISHISADISRHATPLRHMPPGGGTQAQTPHYAGCHATRRHISRQPAANSKRRLRAPPPPGTRHRRRRAIFTPPRR